MKKENFVSRFIVKLGVHATENINVSPKLLIKLLAGFDNKKLLYYHGTIDSDIKIKSDSFEKASRKILANKVNNFNYFSFLTYRVDPYHWEHNEELDHYIKHLVYTDRQLKLKDLTYSDINITNDDIIQKIKQYCEQHNLLLIKDYLECCEYLQKTFQNLIDEYNKAHNLQRQTNLKSLVVYNEEFNEINL